MAEYFLAPVLVKFRSSINAQFPKRDKTSDGWIGDASHAARKSEHNPCWACVGYLRGIVRAIDVDIDDNDAGRDLRKEIIAAAVGHRAIWYVISNGIIWSRTYNWKPRVYTGPNKHFKHVHISCWTSESAAKDQSLVLRAPAKPPAKPPANTGDDMPLNDADKNFITAAAEKAAHRWALWTQLYGIETADDVAAAQAEFEKAIDAGKTPEEAQNAVAAKLSTLRAALKKSQGELG